MKSQTLALTYRSIICLFFFFILSAQSSGQVWQKTNGPATAEIEYLESNGSILVAAVKDKGLFYSNDLGANWVPTIIKSPVRSLLTEGNLVVAFTDDTLFYSYDNCQTFGKSDWYYTGSKSYLKNGVLYHSDFGGGQMSTTLGFTWTPLSFQFNKLHITDSAWFRSWNDLEVSRDQGQSWQVAVNFTSSTQSLKFIESDSNKVWAGTQEHMFFSQDFGRTWSLQYTPVYPYLSDLELYHDTLYLISNIEILRSIDFGFTWSALPRGDYAVIKHPGKLEAHKHNLFKAGFGVYRYNGTSWTETTNGLENASCYNLKSNGNVLFANTFSGVYYSADAGDSWAHCIDLDTVNAGWHNYYFDGGKLFAFDHYNGLYISSDTGKTYSFAGITNNSEFGGEIVYNNGNIYFSNYGAFDGIGRFHISSDMGTTWSTTQIDTINVPSAGYANKIAVSSSAIVYGRRNLFNSTDGGLTWVQRTHFASNYVVRVIYSDNYFYSFSQQGIHRSNDNGVTWIKLPCSGGAIAAYENHVVVGKADSLFYSSNYGASFQLMSKPPFEIWDVAISPPYIYVSAKEESVWRFNAGIPTSIRNESPLNAKKFRLFPNPLTNDATVEIDDPNFSKGTFVLYNVLGKIVFEGQINERTYTLSKNNLSEGVYFYELKDQKGILGTGKLVIQ